VCLAADGGSPQPGAAFVLIASNYYQGTPSDCTVVVDGGSISLTVTATACGGGNANNPVIQAASTPCEIPALPAGSYAVGGRAPWTLQIPAPANAHVCAQ
jgi:hypothetical protein